MSDRELIKLAAKAAGVEGWFANNGADSPIFFNDPDNRSCYGTWTPLTSDGDALRLSVKLSIGLGGSESHVWACKLGVCDIHELRGPDPHAATRRAIVRAAAEIGRGMA